LKELLADYQNKTDASILLSGVFLEGFWLIYTGPRIFSFAKDVISAEINKIETHLKLHFLDFRTAPIWIWPQTQTGLQQKSQRNSSR
jgi:hypothetical protein